MKLSKVKINLIYDLVFSILVFSLPLSMAIPNICLALLIVLYLIKKEKINFKSYVLKATIILISFFILKAILTHTFLLNIFFYKKLLIVLALTLLVQKIENRNLVKIFFIGGVLLAIIITIYNVGNYYLKFHEIPLGDTSQSIKLLMIHRPYFGFMGVLAIIFLLQLKAAMLTKKSYLYLCIFLISSFIVFISARLSLFLILIIFITIILKNKQISFNKAAFYISLSLITLFVIFYVNNNLKQRFHLQNSFKETISELSNYEPRVIIWSCSYNLIKQKDYNFLFGFNDLQNIKNYLVNCYVDKIENKSKREYYITEKFNSHNQFIDFFLSGGIVGLLIFISFFVYIIYYIKLNIYSLLLVLSFILFCFLENVLWRQMGAYLFGIFIPLCEFDSNKNYAK